MKKYFNIGSFFFSPLILTSIVLLLFNDIYLKKTNLAPFLAGKLSDICLMIFFPAVICLGIVYLKLIWLIISKNIFNIRLVDSFCNLYRWEILFSIILTGIILVLLKTSPDFVYVYKNINAYINYLVFSRYFYPSVTMDLTDLFVLPLLIFTYKHLYKSSK